MPETAPKKRPSGQKGKLMNSKRVTRRGLRWLISGSDLYDLGVWTLIVGGLALCVWGPDMRIGFRVAGVFYFLTVSIAYIYTASREFGPLERFSRILILLRFLRIRRQSGKPFGPPPITYLAWGIGVVLAAAYIVASGWQSAVETLTTSLISLTLLFGGGLFWHERLKKQESKPRRRNGWA